MKAFFAVLSLLVCGLWLTSATARDAPAYPVMEWVITPVRDDQTGKVESCIAAAKYKSELALLFIMDDDRQGSMGLYDARLKLSKNRTYEVIVRIDDGKPFKYEGNAQDEDIIAIYFDDDSQDMMRRFRAGRVLHVKLLGRTYAFRLDKADHMLAQLEACVHGNARAPAPDATSRAASNRPDATPPASRSRREAVKTGSGFFITGTGRGITNAHVVAGCTSATISGHGPARILARDPINDLAVVELESKASTAFARFRRTPLQLGETVYAMGFPLAGQLDNGLNFTSGLVSSLAGRGNDTRALQFTAPIQQGNSGGPIVDSGGLVVGIIHSKLDDVAMLQESGSLPQNVNFGIKADLAGSFLRASGFEPREEETMPAQEATALARAGLRYTFQITCTAQ